MIDGGALRTAVAVGLSRSLSVPGALVFRIERFGRDLHEPLVLHIGSLANMLREMSWRTLAVQVALYDEDDLRRERSLAAWRRAGFRQAEPRSYRKTLCISLRVGEDGVWGSLSQSARRGVRSFERAGGKVVQLSDPQMLPWVERLHRETFSRTGGTAPFLGLNLSTSTDVSFQRSAVFLAFATSTSEDTSLTSFGVVRAHGDHAVYDAGGSRRLEGNDSIFGGYSIMWECIRWAIQQGCSWFDLGGSIELDDPLVRHLVGIEEFKRRFSKVRLPVGDEVACEPSPLLSTLASLSRSGASMLRRIVRNTR